MAKTGQTDLSEEWKLTRALIWTAKQHHATSDGDGAHINHTLSAQSLKPYKEKASSQKKWTGQRIRGDTVAIL